jgi:hypothetical protein
VALPVDRAVGVDLDSLLRVEGEIIAADRVEKTIEVMPEFEGANVLIKGFPFDYLERVLSDITDFVDVTIAADDCVTVYYVEEDKDKKVINRAVALTRYCNKCQESCYISGAIKDLNDLEQNGILIVEIQEDGDTFPVNKNPEEDDPGKNHHGVEVDK